MPYAEPNPSYSHATHGSRLRGGYPPRRGGTSPRNPGGALVVAVFALPFACAGAKPPFQFRGPEPKNAADRAMARFAEHYLDASLKLSPISASYAGYHKWDSLLPDFSPQGIERATATLRSYERELSKIPRDKLSTPWAIDHELIARRIGEELFWLTELRPFDWDVQMYNEVIGGAFYYITIPPEDPSRWPDRLEAVVSRLSALPAFLERAKQNLKTPPAVFTEFVIKQNPGHLETLESALPRLFQPHPALERRFERAQRAALTALRDYQTFLETTLLPRSTGDFRLGKERWERKLEMTLQSSMRAEEIQREAERMLEATRFEMYDTALPLFRERWPDDRRYLDLAGDERINYVVSRVIANASEEHGTAESIFEDVRSYAEKVKRFIQETDLIALPPPTDNFVIEPTPSFLDGLAVAFYNPAPAFEPDLKKSYWISTVPKAGTPDGESYLREYNRHTLQSLTIHEAFPGHYVQLYWSSHSPFASITKQVLESGTMSEGWACMIEQVLHEAGYSRGDPKSYLFHLKTRLRIFLNAMIDPKLHASTEDPQEVERWALALLITKGFQEQAEATRKIRRAKLTSAQLSTYFVGYKEMMEIYRSGQKKAGSAFEKRPFLEKMISYGTIPPRMIRKLLELEGLI